MGIAAAVLLGCSEDGSDSGLFGGGYPPYDGGDSGGGSDDGGDDGGDGSDGGGDDGGDGGTTADDGGTTGDDGGTTGGGTTTSSSSGGQACTNPGDIVVGGATGPADANQNCPTTTYPVVVSGSPGPIADVELLLTADVATTSEATLSLQGPTGTTVVLFDKHGGPFTDDFVGTHFDDASNSPVANAPAPRTGCFSPDQPLSAFNGLGGDGTWNLVVQTCLYAVTIQSWELRLTF
jgi:hypothetical protein